MKGKMQYYEAEKERHHRAIAEINEAIMACRDECPHEEAGESTLIQQAPSFEVLMKCQICGALRLRWS